MAVYEIPSYRLQRCLVSPVTSVGYSRYNGGGKVGLTEIMDTLLMVEIATVPLTEAERSQWRAWRNKLRGGLDMFALYDVSKKTPAAYPNATSAASISGSWNGTASVTTLGASGVLTLGGLPSGYVISEDDYIGLEQSGKYDLYSVVAGDTADGTGVAEPIVRPFLRTGLFTTSAVARLWRPKATFLIDDESWLEEGGVGLSPISFSGMQQI